MIKYKRIYFNYFGLGEQDFCYCEVCWTNGKNTAMNWPHHIEAKKMGGSKDKDHINNLMGICYKCDEKYGDKKQYKEYLTRIHLSFMQDGPY